MAGVDMNEFLRLGLTGIARCRERTGDLWEAHAGAAVLAAVFFLEDNALAPEAAREVRRQLEAFVAHAGPALGPPFESGAPGDVALVLRAFEPNVDRLCWVGHNVIYTSLSLRALERVPDMATPPLLAGIARLLELFQRSIPGRSWIGWTTRRVQHALVDNSSFPPLHDPPAVSAFVLEELAAFRRILVAESHHDLIAHLVDFTQAVNALHDLGHLSFFHRALAPVRLLTTVLRTSRDPGPADAVSSPVDEPPLHEAVASPHEPLSAAFWQQNLGTWAGGHTFKFPFAFCDHARRVAPSVARRALPNFLKILGASSLS